VSTIINAVNVSNNCSCLILDATEEEYQELCSLDVALDIQLTLMMNVPDRRYRPHKLVEALKDLNLDSLSIVGCSDMTRRHLESLKDLVQLHEDQDIDHLEISIDGTKPTSCYRDSTDS